MIKIEFDSEHKHYESIASSACRNIYNTGIDRISFHIIDTMEDCRIEVMPENRLQNKFEDKITPPFFRNVNLSDYFGRYNTVYCNTDTAFLIVQLLSNPYGVN
jgi:hypothetical protein